MILRPYQARAIAELWSWFASHPHEDPILEASVGAGKSLLIAAIAKRVVEEAPGARVLVLMHQRELLEQNLDKLMRIWPDADVGVYSAAMGKRSLFRQITYATIGSVYKIAARMGRIDMVLADECHLISPKDVGIWRGFIKDLRRYCPQMRVIGLTGTPFRGNGTWLTADKDALFSAIATRVTMRELLDLGFLAPLVSVKTETRIETADVKLSGGEYVVADLARAADKVELVESACDEIIKLARGRRRWLVFAVTVEHAQHVNEALCRRGVAAAVVHGDTPKAERAEIIDAYRRGTLKCLVNVAVLTTGFDVQEVDFIALLRATKSLVLYNQVCGRGLRVVGADLTDSIRNGKANCIWADFTSTTEGLGPVDLLKGREPPKKGKGEAPFRICDNCGNRNHASALICRDCGHQFPEPERIKHGVGATGAAVMGQEVDVLRPTYEVTEVRYRVHVKQGAESASKSMRVEYLQGLKVVAQEWVLMDHDGYGRRKAEAWWGRRVAEPGIPVPANTDQAVEWAAAGALVAPHAVQVSLEGKYPEIIYYQWEPTPYAEPVADTQVDQDRSAGGHAQAHHRLGSAAPGPDRAAAG